MSQLAEVFEVQVNEQKLTKILETIRETQNNHAKLLG